MKITAHSGCEQTEMNSPEYLRLASELPIWALEIDVRRAADGALLLTHDPIGEKKLIPLTEGLEFLSSKDIVINFDLKEYGLEEDILRLAEEKKIPESRMMFTGSVTDAMDFVKKHPGVTVFINPEELVPDFYEMIRRPEAREETFSKMIGLCRSAGYDTVNIDYRALDKAAFSMLKNARIKISAWTVDDADDMRRMEAAGADYITTNRPSELIDLQ